MDPAARARLAPAALLLATAAAFAAGLRNGFVWDDAQLIVANPLPLSASLVRDAFTRHFWDTAGFTLAGRAHFYRPVVTLAYALTRSVFGHGPLGFHLMNLAAHLGVVALAYGHVRQRLDPERRSPAAPAAAALAVALFALHPARSESVSWASGAPDLWASLFALAALRLDPARRPVASALAFALALLSKEAVAFIPLALALDAICLHPPGERRPALRGAAVLGGTLVAVLGLRALVLPASSNAVGPLAVAVPRVLASLGYLLGRTADPWPLTVWSSRVHHDAAGAVAFPVAALGLGLAFVVGCAAAAWLAWRRPALRPAVADLGWFALALLPVANPIELNLAQLVADRYLYLPHLALAALVARVLLPRVRPVTAVGVAAVAVALGVMAFAHARHFRDEATLWRHEVAVDPDNPVARLSLARAAASDRRYGDALGQARLALLSAQAQNARAVQMDGVLFAASVLLDGLPDADQRGLGSVRSFLDGLGNHPGQPAFLDAGGLRMQLTLRPTDATRVRAMDVEWGLPMGEAALRTLDADRAILAFRALRDRLPHHPRRYAGTAIAWVLLDRPDEAARELDRAPAFVAPALARLRAVLRSPACVDPRVEPARLRIRCALALDLREQVRRLATAQPGDELVAEYFEATITADVRDGLCRRARRRIGETRAAWPSFDLARAEAVAARCGAFVPREE